MKYGTTYKTNQIYTTECMVSDSPEVLDHQDKVQQSASIGRTEQPAAPGIDGSGCPAASLRCQLLPFPSAESSVSHPGWGVPPPQATHSNAAVSSRKSVGLGGLD